MKAYLLAAGQGLRAGGPKAWKTHAGKTLLERQVDFLLSRFEPRDVAVSIQGTWRARCAAINPEVRWTAVACEASPLGALLSLIAASPLTDWGFMHHVDMPVWEPALFALLSRTAQGSDGEALAPVHQGRKGHPIVLSSKIHDALLALDPATDRLDVWLRGRDIRTVEASFSCIHENWNH